MTGKAEQLLREARQLPLEEQWDLVARLMDELDDRPYDDEDEEAWNAELMRRAEAAHSGKEPGIPAEQVYAEVRAKLRRA